MLSEDHKKNRIQMKWHSIKYIEPEGVSDFEKSGLRPIAFIDTPDLERMRALVETEGNLKRGFYTNAEWFKVIDDELKLRNKKVDSCCYQVADTLNKITPPSKSSITKILKQIIEIQTIKP